MAGAIIDLREAGVLVLACALALDVAFGEPPNALHPVVWVGKLIALCERLAPREGARAQLIAGGVIAVVVPGLAVAALYALAALALPAALQLLLAVFLLKSTFALRALGQAAWQVRDALANERLDGARSALRSLCSRDPSTLERPLVIAATIESVAENASDSVVAPVFYYALFGLPGALAYRAVNTLDAMIGYRGRYEYLGKASARLDDVLNFVPARITAALLLCAGWLRGRGAGGLRILRRDRARTESPNAGWPMAAMAGLLGVQLVKPGYYALGDAEEALELDKIDEAFRLAALGSALALLLAAGFVGARHG